MFDFITEDHRLIQQTAREFAEQAIAPIAAHHDETATFPAETIRELGRLGFMGIEIPEVYGGAGMDTMAYILALSEVSRADASHGTIMSVNNSLFGHTLLQAGTEAQKQKYLTPVAAGEKIGAYSLTEPSSGSDASRMRSRAVRSASGSHYVINGNKSWVTSGPVADTVLLFTMTEPDKGYKGITAFIIDTDRPGFHRGKPEHKMGIRASVTSELHFDGYECPVENRIGAEGEGFKIAMNVLDTGRIGIAAAALNCARNCCTASAGSPAPFAKPAPNKPGCMIP